MKPKQMTTMERSKVQEFMEVETFWTPTTKKQQQAQIITQRTWSTKLRRETIVEVRTPCQLALSLEILGLGKQCQLAMPLEILGLGKQCQLAMPLEILGLGKRMFSHDCRLSHFFGTNLGHWSIWEAFLHKELNGFQFHPFQTRVRSYSVLKC
jgi:hypothetical protein